MSYAISLAAGFGVGLLYWLFKVQSPAPPLVALIGLLGMVVGEHVIPIAKAQFFAQPPQTNNAVAASIEPAHRQHHPARLMAKDKFRKSDHDRTA